MITARKTEEHLAVSRAIETRGDTEVLSALVEGQERAISAVRHAIPAIAKASIIVVRTISSGGTLFYAGAGSSIRAGVMDGSELHSTFSLPESRVKFLIAGGPAAMFETLGHAEDDDAAGAAAAASCGAADCLIAIAASGTTPFTLAAATAAKSQGCQVIALVNNSGSPLAATADVEIFLDTGPEVIAGSTRLGAGTAQKAALNLLSTLAFIRLGAVYDGMMVDVAAGNRKLMRRAASIVSAITGESTERSAEALKLSLGHVKPAALMLSGVTSLTAAHKILSDSDGNLRLALSRVKAKE
jgi:N-acetylmuramic acid 6-phosphate etherase